MRPTQYRPIIRCLHNPSNVQQTSSKCIQNTRANAGRLLDRVNTLLLICNCNMTKRVGRNRHKIVTKCTKGTKWSLICLHFSYFLLTYH